MKTVNCKICGHTNKINGDESSVRCESCGCYIDLDNTISNNSIRCPYCNTPLDIKNAKDGVLKCSCKDCHEAITLPKDNQTDDVKQLIENGKIKLNICHFKEALELFNAAIEKAPNEPEAYFNYALARYQIQYLRDIKNRKMQPICHVYRDKPFREDQSYKKALSLAADAQKEVYESKAKEIEKIQIEFAKLEKQKINYDCFICTKVTDDDKKTTDSQKAYDIYHMLQNKGFHPFYSEALMGEYTGEAYEAHILYALYKSQCMLIVCSDEKYLDTIWVKNEYTRYLGLVNSGNKKVKDSLAIIYLNSVIETLPLPGYEDTKLQGLDFNDSVKFSDNLTKFVNKCLKGRVETEKIVVQTGKKEKIINPKQDIQLKTIESSNVVNVNPDLDEVLIKVKSFMHNYNDYNTAKEYLTRAQRIDVNGENSEIDYLSFLIKYKIHSFKELSSELKINVKEIEKIIKKSNSEFAPKIFSEIYQCISGLIDSQSFDRQFVINLYKIVDEYNDESVNKLSKKLISYALETCDNEMFFVAYNARSKSLEYAAQYRKDLLTLLQSTITHKKFEMASKDVKVLEELYSGNVIVLESKLLIKYHCANFEDLFKYETKFNDYNAIKELLEYSNSLDNLIARVTTWINEIIYKLINDTNDKKKKSFYYKHIESLIKFIDDDSVNDNSEGLQRKELKRLGEQAQKDHNFKEAIKYYKLALNIDSDNVELQSEIYFNMALCDLKCVSLEDSYNVKKYIFDSIYYTSLSNYLKDKNRLDLKEKYNEIQKEQEKIVIDNKQDKFMKSSEKAQKIRDVNSFVVISIALILLVFSFLNFSFIDNEFFIAMILFDIVMLFAIISEKLTFRKISTALYGTNQILIFIQSYFITNLIYKMILAKSLITLNLYLSLIGTIILIVYLILQRKNNNEIKSLGGLLSRFGPTLVLGVVVTLGLLTGNIIYLIAGAAVLLISTIILRKYKSEMFFLNVVYVFAYFVFFCLFYVFGGTILFNGFSIIKNICEFDYLKIGITLFLPLITSFIIDPDNDEDAMYNFCFLYYSMILVAAVLLLTQKVNLNDSLVFENSNVLAKNNAFYQLLFCLVPQIFMSVLFCKGIENNTRTETYIYFVLCMVFILDKLVTSFLCDLFNSYTFQQFIILGIDIINILVLSFITFRNGKGGKLITTCITLLFIGGLTFGYIKEVRSNINFRFSLNDNGVTLEKISGKYTKEEKTNIDIPSYYDGKKVTEISSNLFKENGRQIGSFRIPNTIKTINKNAFSNVSIDNILYDGTINDWLNIEFTGNPGWASEFYLINKKESRYEFCDVIEIPDTTTSIGDYQFAGIKSLFIVYIPDSVTTIRTGAFYGCKNATIYCENASLAKLTTKWHESNLSIVYGTNSSSYMTVYLNSNNEIEFAYIGQQENIIIPKIIEKDGKKYTITRIGKHTFDFNKELTSLTIPSGVTQIDEDVFENCTSLENIYY